MLSEVMKVSSYQTVGDKEGAQSHICDDLFLNKELQNRVEQMLSALEVLAHVVDHLRVVLVGLHDAQDTVQTDFSEGRDHHTPRNCFTVRISWICHNLHTSYIITDYEA